jgi:uncharacterized protein YndB with AHSA1/START domain
LAVVPTARCSRTIAAPAQELWELMRDPHHLPRWWPRVTRVEDVTLTGTGEVDAFTEVMKTRKGKLVRADFNVVCDEAERTLTWVQRIEGTPFASVLESAETQLRLAPVDAAGTEVTIELRQQLAASSVRHNSFLRLAPRFGGRLVRRAATATIEEALDGLERVSG